MNRNKNKSTRIKEKFLIIMQIFKSGQYAFYAINKGYVNRTETPEKATCFISDDATTMLLEAEISYTEKLIDDKNNKNL